MINRELILVVDFGGQYNQLIARRVRENNVYCEIVPYTCSVEKIKKMNPKGLIFTGGPNSVYAPGAPKLEKEIFELGVPVLGICYGAQLMAHMFGGEVITPNVREYGKIEVDLNKDAVIFAGLEEKQCWMSHTIFKKVQHFIIY